MEMSANSPPSDCGQTELFPTSSLAASPARTFRSPEKAQEWLASAAASGPSMPDLLARYDPSTSSWRTWQLCLVEGLETFSATWPRSGMMRSGIAYQLPPLVPLTDATASGYWPTPNSSSNDKTPCKTDADLAWQSKPRANGAKVQARLQDAAAFWPTPTAKDTGLSTDLDHIQLRREKVKAKGINGNGFGMSLGEAVRRWPTPRANDAEKCGDFDVTNPRNGLPAAVRLYPTPTRSMHKGSSAGAMTRLSGASRLNDRLDYRVEQGNIKTGRLNPLWVAWLMGFPIEWASFAPTETP